MNHFTPHQELMQYKKPNISYLLDKLQEESAEVIQAVSKIRRFGEQSNHPDRTTTNIQDLINELEDMLAIIAVLESSNYFDLTKSKNNIANKAQLLLR